MPGRIWSREEFMLVMNLYAKIPYGQFHAKNKDVINLSKILNRTPGAVAYKLVHFASLDPYHKKRGIQGLGNPGNNAIKIFEEFQKNWNELMIDSELLLAKYQNKDIKETLEDFSKAEDLLLSKRGEDATREVRTRVNQALFRKVIVNNYHSSCAVCGLDISSLLIASHILKWSENEAERLNPTNGMCLCNIHDKAFELGYLGIMKNYEIVVSPKIETIKEQETANALFARHQSQKIILPDKYYPNPLFLDKHFEEVFIR